jgi:hypothetical protein
MGHAVEEPGCLDRGHALHPHLCSTHDQMGLDWPSRIHLRCAARSPIQGMAARAGITIFTALYCLERAGKGAYVKTSLLAEGVRSASVSIQGAFCGAYRRIRASGQRTR